MFSYKALLSNNSSGPSLPPDREQRFQGSEIMKTSSKVGLAMLALSSVSSGQAQIVDVAPTPPEQVEIAQTLIDTHFQLWNSADPSQKKDLFGETYTKDFFVADYHGLARGYDATIALI